MNSIIARIQSELVIKQAVELVGVRNRGVLRSREARRNRWAVRVGVVPSGLVPAYDW